MVPSSYLPREETMRRPAVTADDVPRLAGVPASCPETCDTRSRMKTLPCPDMAADVAKARLGTPGRGANTGVATSRDTGMYLGKRSHAPHGRPRPTEKRRKGEPSMDVTCLHGTLPRRSDGTAHTRRRLRPVRPCPFAGNVVVPPSVGRRRHRHRPRQGLPSARLRRRVGPRLGAPPRRRRRQPCPEGVVTAPPRKFRSRRPLFVAAPPRRLPLEIGLLRAVPRR